MVWSKQPTSEPKPLPRYSHTQVLIDDAHILVLGGCGGPNMQFSDTWLLDMSVSVWQWTQLTVVNANLAVQQLWCHPASLVGDKLVVLGKNVRTQREATVTSAPHSLQTHAVQPVHAAQPASGQIVTTPPSVLSLSLNDDERVPASSSSSASSSISQAHTAGPRAGMPSVRPNAMKDRRRQLEALKRYEDKLRAAAHRSSPTSVPASSAPRRYSTAGMCVHVLDISQAVDSGQVTWLPIQGMNLTTSPDEATFYSLVECRGELMMFGGIRGDARNLQRGSTSLQPQAVSSDVNFLSFRPKQML